MLKILVLIVILLISPIKAVLKTRGNNLIKTCLNLISTSFPQSTSRWGYKSLAESVKRKKGTARKVVYALRHIVMARFDFSSLEDLNYFVLFPNNF